MRALMIAIAFAFSSLSFATPASAQMDQTWRAGTRVNVIADNLEGVWAVGAIVSIRGNVRDVIRACGAEVDIDATTGGDVNSCGAIVSVKGAIGRDLLVASARSSVDARVAGNLKVVGARVLIGPQTQVQGETTIAGAEVIFAGTSQGPATFHGDTVRIDGRITGNVLVRARSVTVGKGAVIEGAIAFETFGDPLIESGATVRGRQTVTMPQPPEIGPGAVFLTLGAMFLFAVGAGLVLGIMLLIAARPFVERAIDRMRTAPGRSALVGFGVLILVPVVAVVLMVTVVGIPIGLLMLLAFPFTLLSAGVLAAFGLSDWLMNRGRSERSWGGRVLLLLVGLIILTLVGLIPILGFVTWVIALMIGLGALWQGIRSAPATGGALVT
jgi:cytoskeletal protein CcmA (bactofilin family)